MKNSGADMLEYIKDAKKVRIKTVYFASGKQVLSKPATITECSRLIIPISGLMWIEFSDHSKHIQMAMRSGEVLFCSPFAWTNPKWHLDGKFISLVYLKNYLRTVYVDQKDNQPRLMPDCFCHTSDPANPAALNLIHALEFLSNKEEFRTAANPIVKSLIQLAIFDISTDTSPTKTKALNTWHMLSGYIHENYTQDITRQELAELFELHPSYISKLVRTRTGITLQEYITQLRMELAKQLLGEPEAHVGHISKTCGFHDTSYFIKSFRRLFGVTPGQYHSSTLDKK